MGAGSMSLTDAATTKRAPVIGVSSSEVRAPSHLKEIPEGEPPQREVCLGMPYLNAIQQVGGVPLIIAPLQEEAIDRVLDSIDALCLSGGPDLDPKTYNRAPHPQLGPTEYAIDKFELALTRAAYLRGMPILAICRGMQLLNVARGGTLYQHIPDEPGEEIEHRQQKLGHYRTHQINVIPNTLLYDILRKKIAEVNSFHHQAIEQIGTRLRVSAHSQDGIVEGIEALDREYVVGVQWHAESLTDSNEHEALFAGLIEAATKFQQSPPARKIRAV